MFRVARLIPVFALFLLPFVLLAADEPLPGGLDADQMGPEPPFVFVGNQVKWKLMAMANNPAFVRAEAKGGIVNWSWKSVRVETNDKSAHPKDPNWIDDPDVKKHKIEVIPTSQNLTSAKATLQAIFGTPGFKRITVLVTLRFEGIDGKFYTAQQPLQPVVPVGQVLISRGGKLIQGQKIEVVVGENIKLSGDTNFVPAKAGKLSFLWTIPGDTVKSYTQSLNTAVKTDLTAADKQHPSISYYWIAGSGGKSHKVELQASVNGQTGKASVEFEVQRPTATLTSKTTTLKTKTSVKGVDISSNYGFAAGTHLHFGKKGDPGITWTGTVTAPAISGGEIAFVQRINTVRNFTADDKQMSKTIKTSEGKFVLDIPTGAKSFLYEGPKMIGAGMMDKIEANDSPATPLDAKMDLFASIDEQFETYLMFKPETKDSIWVTLRVVPWFWKGSASQKSKYIRRVFVQQ